MKEILSVILSVDEQLGDVLIQVAPNGVDETLTMQQLSRLRDRLDLLENRLIDLRFKAATLDLSAEAQALTAKADELAQLNRNMDGVRSAIQVATQVLTIAGSVLTKLVSAA